MLSFNAESQRFFYYSFSLCASAFRNKELAKVESFIIYHLSFIIYFKSDSIHASHMVNRTSYIIHRTSFVCKYREKEEHVQISICFFPKNKEKKL